MCLHAYTYMPIYTCSLIYILFGKHIHHTYSFSCMPAYKHMHTCAYALVNTCTHTHTPMRIHNRTCKETKAQTRPHTGTYTFMHIQVYTLTQVCMYAGTYFYMSCTHVRVFACCTALPRPILPCHRVRYHTMPAPAALPCLAMPQHTTPYHTTYHAVLHNAQNHTAEESMFLHASADKCVPTYACTTYVCTSVCLHTYRPIDTTLTNVVVSLLLLCISPLALMPRPSCTENLLASGTSIRRRKSANDASKTVWLFNWSFAFCPQAWKRADTPGHRPSRRREKPKPNPKP